MVERIDVFISSTSRDLEAHREAVTKVILRLGLYPIIMETFNPTDRNALQLCYDKMQDAEIFIGIYAHRYGYIPKSDVTYTNVVGKTLAGDGETSLTHLEYMWAQERGLPLLLFVVSDTDGKGNPLTWPILAIEDEPGKTRLHKFKDMIMGRHVVGFFSSPDNLATQVASSLSELIKKIRNESYIDTSRHINLNASSMSSVETIKTNLPPRRDFVGRDKEIKRLEQTLATNSNLIMLIGIGGVGKTALLTEVCYRLVEQVTATRFQSILWITCNDDSIPNLSDIFDDIARLLDANYVLTLGETEKRKAIYEFLRKYSLLIIIDNLNFRLSGDVIEFFESIPKPSQVIIASRSYFDCNAKVINISGMSLDDTKQMVHDEFGFLDMEIDETDADYVAKELYQHTDGIPLAIKWALRQISNRGYSVDSVISQITKAKGDIFEGIFERTWTLIDQLSQNLLMLASLFPSPINKEMGRILLSKGKEDEFSIEDAIGELVQYSLVEPNDKVREIARSYSLHALTRVFAYGRLSRIPNLEPELKQKSIDVCVQMALNWQDTWRDFNNLVLLDRQRDNLLRAAQWIYEFATTSEKPDIYWKNLISLAEALASFLWARGYWNERLRLCRWAMEGAKYLNDIDAEVRLWNLIGRVHLWRGDVIGARESADNCIQKIPLVSKPSQKLAYSLDALIASYEGRYPEAEDMLLRVLELADEDDATEFGRAATLVDLGIVAYRQGNYISAKARFSEAFEIDKRLPSVEGQAVACSHLANTELRLGDLVQAEDLFQKGIELARQVGRLSTEARCYAGLAEIYAVKQEDMPKVNEMIHKAKDIFGKLRLERELQNLLRLETSTDPLSLSQEQKPKRSDRLVNFDGIVFDFDDTLVTTYKVRSQSLILAAQDFGYKLTQETIQSNWGKPFKDLIVSMLPGINFEEFYPHYTEIMYQTPPIAALGTREVLEHLWKRKATIVILSSSAVRLIRQDLQQLDLEKYFSFISGSDDTNYHKPDPRVLGSVIDFMNKNNISRERIVKIGDSVRDYQVAKGNNINFIGVTSGLETTEDFLRAGLEQQYVVSNLLELL